MSGIMYKNRPYAGGGGAGGASALSDLTDTSISSPTNGQVLKYNNGFWENDDESGGTTVVANPQGAASADLEKLQVGNDIYDIPQGTEVVANPTGTPTEELSTIQIGQDIYEIVGGGGSGSGFEQTLLWDYVTDNNNSVLFGTFNVTLHDDINNYDFLLVEIVSSSGDLSSAVWNSTNQFIVNVDALNNSYNNNYFSYTSFNERSSRYYIKDTTFQKTIDNQGNTNGLVKVYGLKFSGGSGSSDDYSTTEQTIGSWIDGKPIYQITYAPSSTLHTNGKAWVDTGMVISDIESIIDFEIVAKDTYVNMPANIKCAFFRYYNNNIQIYVVDQWYLDILAVTVKYTKTTD